MSSTSETPEFTTQEGKVEDEQESKDKESRSTLLRKAYGEATQKLREAHRDEFDTLYEQSAKRLGVTDYKRKPTPEEKAKEEVERLLTQFPGLRENL